MPAALNTPVTQYSFQVLQSGTDEVLTVPALASRLIDVDVVVIGEYHGHHASHLLQSQLQVELHRRRPQQVLSLEQFNRDQQAVVDRYLAGEIGETELIEDAGAWDNYRASYRPLMEFARHQSIPVVAANAPAKTVRCVGRHGAGYLDRLPADARQQVASRPFLDTPGYRDKFAQAIGDTHGSDEFSDRMRRIYQAQLLRDNTMAESIVQALERYPGRQILHLTGTFHAEDGSGTVALLRQRAPELRVVVISPVIWPIASSTALLDDHRSKGDYLYFIQPLPDEFKNPERAQAAMADRFRSRSDDGCS